MTSTNTTQAALHQANNSLANATTRKTVDKDTLGKQDFLNLLMAQVTHQDPLNPMDSQGMMDQLTQMGSMEQLVNLNKKVDGLNFSQEEMVRSTAYSFLDRDITIHGGQTAVTGGSAPKLHFELPREAAEVRVVITDNGGVPVRTLDLGRVAAGQHNLAWDAKDRDADPVSDGMYRYNITAKSPEDETLPVNLLMRGKVSGIKFKDGRPLLMMNGAEIALKDILEVSNASTNIFSAREPRPLMEELKPKPPAEVP